MLRSELWPNGQYNISEYGTVANQADFDWLRKYSPLHNVKDGVRYSHILNPRTGWPVRDAPRSLTVVAGSCTEAGLLATIAMIYGRGAEAFPVVKDGVIYTTAHNMTAAVDALTGKQLWRTAHDYPPETLRVVCCGIVNRGVAIYNGMIIRLLLDNQIIAMDAKTGDLKWEYRRKYPEGVNGGTNRNNEFLLDGARLPAAFSDAGVPLECAGPQKRDGGLGRLERLDEILDDSRRFQATDEGPRCDDDAKDEAVGVPHAIEELAANRGGAGPGDHHA